MCALVTGVQTCALPICRAKKADMTVQALDRLGNGFSDLLDVLDSDDIARVEAVLAEVRDALGEVRAQGARREPHEVTGGIRAEERRVGKEWVSTGRSRRTPYH